jgi:WD40 repeat protein
MNKTQIRKPFRSILYFLIIFFLFGNAYSQKAAKIKPDPFSLETTFRNSSMVFCLAKTPDNKYIASGDFEGNVKLWSMETKNLYATLKTQEGWVNTIAFSPNNKLIAFGGSDNSVKIWNIKTNELFNNFSGFTQSINAVYFLNDSLLLIAANELRLYNIITNEILNKFSYNDITILSLDVNPAKTTAAIGLKDNDIIIIDLNSFSKIKTLVRHQNEVSALAFSPDGKTLTSGSMDSTIIFWDTKTWKHTKTVRGHSEQINSLCFSPDKRYLFSGGWDNQIMAYDLKTFSGDIFRTHINVISSLLCIKDYLISGSYDKTIKVWKLRSGN